ncbi:hypothetical protein U5801_00995 [Lamprobacter modestohalophilus]|uniref:hypothetical protein n=1 Tax=Lamprobacter modestohalophilus TaxID=1064514 RepID=UPI002ADEBE0A|nr:hypothetical protein [Lamprobacter modestohalophilus]MEA1048400.1 hypothetical protein [Lamprobacter modestohalophilus]
MDTKLKQKIANLTVTVCVQSKYTLWQPKVGGTIAGTIYALPKNGAHLMIEDIDGGIHRIGRFPYVINTIEKRKAEVGDVIVIYCEKLEKQKDGAVWPKLKMGTDKP